MTNSKLGSESENLSRIRDILFGEDLQGIEQKLNVAKDENLSVVEKLKEELEIRFKKIELLQQERFKEVDKKHVELDKVHKTTTDELKLEIAKLSKEINSSIEQFEIKFSSFEKSINNTIIKFKEEYDLKFNELENNKLDKVAMADILNELAEKLKK
ncbi:MAG: hypothetical protein QM503_01615 [Bacteroidota bacterium]